MTTKYPPPTPHQIADLYHAATDYHDPGKAWYQTARDEIDAAIARPYGIPLRAACGIVAALSPLRSWTDNIPAVIRYLETGRNQSTTAHMAKAIAIHRNPTVVIDTILCRPNAERGYKVLYFYRQLYAAGTDYTGIPLDRHMLRSIGRPDVPPVSKMYHRINHAYLSAARMLDIEPGTLQASIWLYQQAFGRST